MARAPLFVSAFLLVLSTVPAPAQAYPLGSIAPGDMIVISGGAVCTLNFVFDGTGNLSGNVYIGTAAHCLAGNWNATFDHYNGRNVAGTSNGGYLAGFRDISSFATVAYTGDYDNSVNGGTAVSNGIPGMQLDFALLLVKPAYEANVDAAVRGYPGMPSGYTLANQTALGDLLYHSGHGAAYSDVQLARENHVGVLWSDTTSTYVEVGTTMPGDSGGPILHESGKAFGIVSASTVGFQIPPVQDLGPTVQGVLAEMAALGYTVELRTA